MGKGSRAILHHSRPPDLSNEALAVLAEAAQDNLPELAVATGLNPPRDPWSIGAMTPAGPLKSASNEITHWNSASSIASRWGHQPDFSGGFPARILIPPCRDQNPCLVSVLVEDADRLLKLMLRQSRVQRRRLTWIAAVARDARIGADRDELPRAPARVDHERLNPVIFIGGRQPYRRRPPIAPGS
jgi:hypothetical protein